MDSTTPPSATTRPQVEGICYVPDYLDQETHNRLLSTVDEHAWQMSADRRVQVYGYSYNHQERSAYHVGDLPAWAQGLARRLCRDGYISRVPNQLVANDYQPGVGIFAHIDQEVFGDVVMTARAVHEQTPTRRGVHRTGTSHDLTGTRRERLARG